MSIIDINSQITSIQSNTAQMEAQKRAERTDNTEMGQDAFLMLMMTQLQNQDPLEPMGDTEFISQQAQFTQVTELQKLNDSLVTMNTMNQASSLIGKEVSIINPDAPSETIAGKISEARSDGSQSYVVFEGREDYAYPLNLIMGVKEAGADTSTRIIDQEGNETVLYSPESETEESVIGV